MGKKGWRTMPRILVNCHGGRTAATPVFVLPAGVSVHFYIADGGILPNVTAWQVLDNRLRFQAPGAAVTTLPGGQPCQDYYGVPYRGLGVADGLLLENAAGNGFESVLSAGLGQNWGLCTPNTVQTRRLVLPSVRGGPAYERSVVALSDIVNCPGVTDVDWITCREVWL
jgi:hypothetical protein